MKALSGVRFCAFLKSTICLLLSICLMSWKITCSQMAAVGVQLFHCGGEKRFTIAQFKGSAAIRAKLTSLLRTPSCHLHQRTFKSYLPSFRKHLVRAKLVQRCLGSKICRRPNKTFSYFSRVGWSTVPFRIIHTIVVDLVSAADVLLSKKVKLKDISFPL